jgi:broad specificity phosphatase PhoE
LLIDFKDRNILEKYLKEPNKWKKIQFDHSITFPENYGHFSQRVTAFKKTLVYPKADEAILYITHGFVVR